MYTLKCMTVPLIAIQDELPFIVSAIRTAEENDEEITFELDHTGLTLLDSFKLHFKEVMTNIIPYTFEINYVITTDKVVLTGNLAYVEIYNAKGFTEIGQKASDLYFDRYETNKEKMDEFNVHFSNGDLKSLPEFTVIIKELIDKIVIIK